MAAVNSVQNSLRLPLAGLAPPRVLMCSASMGAQGSVTLQLREAVPAPDSGTSLDGALTIGYPDSDMFDMLGTFQTANSISATDTTTFDIIHSDNRNNSLLNGSILSASKSANPSTSSLKIRTETLTKPNSDKPISSAIVNSTTASKPVTTASIATLSTLPVKKPRPKTASPTRHGHGPQQCQVCSKVFGNASALAKHKLTHSDERKYVCGMCSKAFKRQDHLNGHMLTHRNKKPYECKAEGCGKSYCDARSLRRHTENHHSALAMTPSTPSNQTTPPSGLSLSPATASGNASSPHGATCVQYTTSNSSSDSSNSKSPSPSSPDSIYKLNRDSAGAGNEGLTRQQLDLISQIMQQTKQANAGKNNQRPRTWNMQMTQVKQPMESGTVSNGENPSNGNNNNNTSNNNGLIPSNASSLPKIEQKPVECNLCHRKFKNIPALNGHMRLHGGYFKKDSETKKCDKKESNGPPLQTASVGVRALIEEKIINKRSKDLKNLLSKGFVVPAPPLTVRRASEINGNTIAIVSQSVAGGQQIITTTPATITTTTLQNQPKKTILTTTANGAAIITNENGTTLATTKDATLIELLKRGTKVAVKRAISDPGQQQIATTGQPQVTTTTTTARVVLPSLNSTTSLSTPSTPSSTPPLALSTVTKNATSIATSSGSTPLSLTISQAPSGNSDVFTLAYSTDAATHAFFSDNDVYNDTMLLQAVDSIQLLQDATSANDQLDDLALTDYPISETENISQQFTPSRQLQAVLDSPLPESLAEFSALHSKDYVLYGCASTESPTTQSSNSPLPSPLAYPTPPASHEAVAQSSPFLDDSRHFSDTSSFFDDKRTQQFLDDTNDPFFKDSKDAKLTDNERILQLKNELFNDSKNILDDHCELFKNDENFFESKPSDAVMGNSDKLQNLDFLDEPQAFIDDQVNNNWISIPVDDSGGMATSCNPSSPLSAAFFSATMSSAEEVKEALEEVKKYVATLPNEEDDTGADIDLYYLPSLSLQSQMMPNSDDPLLSSSPKDFVHRHQLQKFLFEQSTTSSTNPTQNGPFNPPNAKKSKTSTVSPTCSTTTDEKSNIEHSDTNKIPLTVQTTEQIPKDSDSVFLSPSSLSSSGSSSSGSPKQNQRKRSPNLDLKYKNQQIFKTKLRKTFSTSHFTPSPVLNPDRFGAGLFSSIHHHHDQQQQLIDDIDFDIFNDPPILVRPKINIGFEHQAIISDRIFNLKDHSYTSANEFDQLMWDPSVNSNEKDIQRFIELSKSSAVPLGSHSEEMALKALLEANGEIHIAILSLLQTPTTAIYKRWSSSEMQVFVHGLETYGKDFFRISKDLINKSTADCVQLYYFWKKLCHDYKTTHLFQPQSQSSSSKTFSDDSQLVIDQINLLNQHTSNSLHGHQHHHHLNHNHSNNHSSEIRPHVCEVPDCSASFTSKAALLGHTRIHCIGRNINTLQNGYLIR